MSQRLVGVAGITLALLIAGPRTLSAQDARQPTVTVVPFEGDRGAKIEHTDGGAIADTLAARLVASGRYRVLDRAWLPGPKSASGPLPLRTLRDGATAAGVEYLVAGSVYESTIAVARRAPTLTLPFAMLARGRMAPRGAIAPPVAPRETRVTLDVTVFDTRSGEIVRTMTARNAPALTEAITDITSTLLRLAPQLTQGTTR